MHDTIISRQHLHTCQMGRHFIKMLWLSFQLPPLTHILISDWWYCTYRVICLPRFIHYVSQDDFSWMMSGYHIIFDTSNFGILALTFVNLHRRPLSHRDFAIIFSPAAFPGHAYYATASSKIWHILASYGVLKLAYIALRIRFMVTPLSLFQVIICRRILTRKNIVWWLFDAFSIYTHALGSLHAGQQRAMAP